MLDKFFRPRPVDLFGTNPGSSEKLRDVHIGRKVADRQAAGPCESHGEKEYYLCQIYLGLENDGQNFHYLRSLGTLAPIPKGKYEVLISKFAPRRGG